ncbi:MAG: alpha/beta fold hydrolase [Actinophytocola sp.]|uniref:alpha/beta fold hydrolase n=1 Tax=Actinophytocola sp. TaxID=1872138 RepID=UPI0013258384|nr:alpha/beta hydrolase [Actinophytocola sp.]MPZ84269.1 alpha/beta fold hydrolase [Actinophytocola sp.]
MMIETNGVELCVETFGAAADPAVLLVHGACASMLWWEAELCERIAAAGRFVIRFDNRDTGRSVSYPAGRPGYSLRDMAADAIGVLDALGVGRAHLVGRSMAGAIVTTAALEHPDRVASLTLVSTTTGAADLPPMSAGFLRHVGAGGPDPADPAAVVDHIVGLMRAYSGESPYHDENAVRLIAERDVARTRDFAACLTNHFAIELDAPAGLGDIAVPTLVVHGELDPVFPLPHGQALRDAIPGATLLIMDKAGHELPPPVWDLVVPALVAHTAATGR